MPLITTSKTILDQMRELITQLRDEEYYHEIDVLSGNTIGKHVRHVLEFFDLLLIGDAEGTINYDQRKHDYLLETNRKIAITKTSLLMDQIDKIELGKPLVLQVNYSETTQAPMSLKTSIDRELAYNIEHAIHHMAIIKIAVTMLFPNVKLPADFGIAFSTLRYQKSLSGDQPTV